MSKSSNKNLLKTSFFLKKPDKKNDNANRTIQFINSQLDNVSDSLNTSENRMQNFQSRNQVLNISTQSDQLLQQMNDLDKEKVSLETKNKFYYYLKDYLYLLTFSSCHPRRCPLHQDW